MGLGTPGAVCMVWTEPRSGHSRGHTGVGGRAVLAGGRSLHQPCYPQCGYQCDQHPLVVIRTQTLVPPHLPSQKLHWNGVCTASLSAEGDRLCRVAHHGASAWLSIHVTCAAPKAAFLRLSPGHMKVFSSRTDDSDAQRGHRVTRSPDVAPRLLLWKEKPDAEVRGLRGG